MSSYKQFTDLAHKELIATQEKLNDASDRKEVIAARKELIVKLEKLNDAISPPLLNSDLIVLNKINRIVIENIEPLTAVDLIQDLDLNENNMDNQAVNESLSVFFEKLSTIIKKHKIIEKKDKLQYVDILVYELYTLLQSNLNMVMEQGEKNVAIQHFIKQVYRISCQHLTYTNYLKPKIVKVITNVKQIALNLVGSLDI